MLLALQQPVDVAESVATLDVICGAASSSESVSATPT